LRSRAQCFTIGFALDQTPPLIGLCARVRCKRQSGFGKTYGRPRRFISKGLGYPHSNRHVLYPMSARHRVPEKSWPPCNGKELKEKFSKQALQLHQTLFNPDRLQDIFVQK